ncbi:Tetratricopeptide-like helical [Kalmanozyma brasiliensis GHG001]|uniref:TPR-like protein n=1 Tax=Kalmanozyma brasiliensis (strain GHG001) TaxID=1365824 RepID=V5EUX6_KALBG|nr:Tetratricopeptide-like helical [Kalmanozyma brasiliensis GHG001]EST09210.1 Tetratricopeptide-like helical [Kalmanozyma brasiliensis GHG001]
MAVIEEAHISEEIHELKAQANRQFSNKDYDGALSTYLDILAKLPAREAPTTSTTEADDSGYLDAETDDEDVLRVASSEKEKEKEKDKTRTASSSPPPKPSREAETEEQEQIRLFRSVIYANIAATHLRLDQHRDAVKACNQSLLDRPNYVKALYRRAQANEQIGGWAGFSSALEDNKLLLTLPDLPPATRPEVTASIQRIEPRAQQAAEKEKDEMISKLKGLGDSILGNFGLSTKNFQFAQQPGGGYSMNFVR